MNGRQANADTPSPKAMLERKIEATPIKIRQPPISDGK
jgi:hypothetical protein